FAKNSDRDANEGQFLEWHPARDWPEDAEVQCTEVAIAQALHTHAVLLSRPFWIWGAEMGANEHGVVIGNEAVFTRKPVPRTGLLGMDLLRLALERAASAEEAVQVLVTLLEVHGQGGRGGFEDPSFRYHNSFLVADPHQAWVVETSGREHAEEQVTEGVRTISNVLTIPRFRQTHLGFVGAVKSRVAVADRRRARSAELASGATEVRDMLAVLRDHGAERDGPSYRWLNGTLGAACMHGGGAVAHSVTTASWVAELGPEGNRHWVTASSGPCISLFKPVRVDQPLDLGPFPQDRADDSLWWRHERLHRTWLRDPAQLGALFLPERDEIEGRWLQEPPEPSEAFSEWEGALSRWVDAVGAAADQDVRPAPARRYWRKRNDDAALDLG
ncbi:MAG: C69 family dipeptidase, partial [Deltaproteobacteria bacterium]|nr:C69 family dipeptidase [Deltaproteobacteria bacterium]